MVIMIVIKNIEGNSRGLFRHHRLWCTAWTW